MRLRVPRWVGWAIAASGIGFVTALVVVTEVPTESLTISAPVVTGLFLAQAAVLLPESLKMQVILERASGMRFEWLFMLRVFVLSRILNLAVPQSGAVFRVAEINSRYGARITETTGGMVAFIWVSTVANLTAATVVALVWESDSPVPPIALVSLALGSIAAPLTVLVLIGRLSGTGPVMGRLVRLSRSVVLVVQDSSTVAKFAGLWASTVTLVVAIYAASFMIAGDVPSISLLIVLYTLVQASSFLTITPGNLGVQEIGFVAIAVLFGVDAGVAAAAALVIRLSGTAVNAVSAIPLSAVK